MLGALRNWLRNRPHGIRYARRPRMVLINGLAEQAESWYANVAAWRQHFDVYAPNLLAYEGSALHRRIDERQPITIDYLLEQLRRYLEEFVQAPPYHLVANSLGGKIAVEFAARYPEQVSRLVLLCPSGLSDEERLPVVDGVRRNDVSSLVDSVFHDARHADRALLTYFQGRFANRRWRTGLLKTLRGTMEHRVRDRLPDIRCPTLLVVGQQDRIVDPAQSIAAAQTLREGRLVVLDPCGHAPQIERASLVNRLVTTFLSEERGGMA